MSQWTQKARRLAAVLTVITLAYPLGVRAQSAQAPVGNGFRISPVRSEFIVAKGTSKTFTITLENPAATPLKAHPVVNDFIPSADESGEPRLILDSDTVLPRNDFKRLVSPLEDIIIPGNQRKDIPITISVPSYADAGGYYGAVRFIPVIPTEQGRNVALTASIGSIVLIQVPGEIRQQLDLVQLSAAQNGTGRGFIIGGNVGVLTRLKNSGNIHVKPFGKVQIKNAFGKVIYEYEFNNTDPRANVLPDSIRKFVDELPNKHWLGRYSINMNLTYTDGGGEIISAKSTFWYFPVAVFYGCLVLLLILVVFVNYLIYKYRRHRKTHHKR